MLPPPYMSLATFRRVLEAAPKHLWGFEFSEIDQRCGPRDQRSWITSPPAGRAMPNAHRREKKFSFRNREYFGAATVTCPIGRAFARRSLPRRFRARVGRNQLSHPGAEPGRSAGLVAFRRVGSLGLPDRVYRQRLLRPHVGEWSSHSPEPSFAESGFRVSSGRRRFLQQRSSRAVFQGVVQQLLPFYEMLAKGMTFAFRSGRNCLYVFGSLPAM